VIDRIAKAEIHKTELFDNVPTQPVVIEAMRTVK